MNRSVWEGDQVRLRGIEPEDWEQFHRWDTDTSIQRSSHHVMPPRSREATRQWAREQSQTNSDHEGDEIGVAVETVDGKLVGSITTHGCDARNGSFNVGVALGREHWSKGYAMEAIQLLLRYYFDEMRYQKANARVYDFNENSKGLFERLGFSQEGRIRSAFFAGGEHHDVLWYGITGPEFRERYPDFALPLSED